MAYTKFATSEPYDIASGKRLNKFGDELQQQINVLKEAKLITSLNEITESIKYKGAMIANAPVQDFIIIDATVFDSTWKVATAYTLNLNLIWKGVYKNSVWTWEPIATTTKTSFLCSANTGYTIINQDCYTMNGEYNILLRIAKTDGGTFSTSEQVVATVPINILNTVNSPFTVIARNSSSIWTDYVTAQLIGATKEIRVTASGSSTNNIILSCRGRLL